jgi:DNA-binding CsgD family transcriptional regulator
MSKLEEQCLLWAARGKTFQEIAEILGLAFGTVKRTWTPLATNYTKGPSD